MMFFDILIYTASLLFAMLAIGFCIFSHELGHFLAARWRGLHIDAFSIGFRPIWRKKVNGIEYRIGWLPFGGYVELPQIDATDQIPKAADGTELARAKPLDRIITAAAGPFFNIISGLLVACVVWAVGMPRTSPRMSEITVMTVNAQSPEYQAGLRSGDTIVKVNGKPFNSTWVEFVNSILFTIGDVEYGVRRDGRDLSVRFAPQPNPDAPGSLRHEKVAYPFFRPLIPIAFSEVAKGSPAERAGIVPGDMLIYVNDELALGIEDIQMAFNLAAGEPVKLTLENAEGVRREVEVTPETIPGGQAYTRYLVGINMRPASQGVMVDSVRAKWPAAKAGISGGDLILSINGEKISSPEAMQNALSKYKDQPLEMVVFRDGKILPPFKLTARAVEPRTIGITVDIREHPSPAKQFVSMLEQSYKTLRNMSFWVGKKMGLTEKASSLNPTHISGPLGMGMVLFQSVESGSLITGIYFIALISFALAIFNLLPLPVLDGGHVAFGLFELIFRRPVPTVIIKGLSAVFVVLLIALMLFATYIDGRRLYRNRFADGEPAPNPAVENNNADAARETTAQP
ncbi:MAG: site-2 protease family protein [Victivallaceae bacterium]|nr:site-2 protease family protein [Victivallaceae bacterium]